MVRSVHSWEGTPVEDIDELAGVEFWTAWTKLRTITDNTPGVSLRGICPVVDDQNDNLHWAAIAWVRGTTWRGIGTRKVDAVLALCDVFEQNMASEQPTEQSSERAR